MGLLQKSKESRTSRIQNDIPATIVKSENSNERRVGPTTSGNVEKDVASSSQDSKSKAENSNQLEPKSSWHKNWPRKSTTSTRINNDSVLAQDINGESQLCEPILPESNKRQIDGTLSSTPYRRKSEEKLCSTNEIIDRENNICSMSQATKLALVGQEFPRCLQGKDSATLPVPEKSLPKPGMHSAAHASSKWSWDWLRNSISQPVESGSSQPDVKLSELSNDEENLKDFGTSEPVKTPLVQNDSLSHWFSTWFLTRELPTVEVSAEQISFDAAEPSQDLALKDISVEPSSQIKVVKPASYWAFWLKGSKVTSGPQNNPEPAKISPNSELLRSPPSLTSRPEKYKFSDFESKALQSETINQNGLSVQSQVPSNLLLPSLSSTYQVFEPPCSSKRIARMLFYRQQSPERHVFLSTEFPKVKKAIAIGIHGLFPAPLLRSVIGHPTGTSIRFVNHAAEAIHQWCIKQGLGVCEIEKVALEGEGKIFDRVENLWKLLLNWIHHVRKADFILVACHSQGVPVAVMLVAKLVELGAISTGRIGICAMAGVSLGPFAEYKSRLFSGSAGELFDLADPESDVSKGYERSLRIALRHGVRITYCGSIDDQLVPMESSVFSTVTHPYIYRAVFIDGRLHASDFISRLVGLTLKMRNLGASDHGLIRELSGPLAGKLYNGEGHSRLYDDSKVYDLAIEFALQTTSVDDIPLEIKKNRLPSTSNPFALPWIMRGLLEEEIVKTKLNRETKELLELFDSWKPTTKVLRDVKYRLEPVRSKL